MFIAYSLEALFLLTLPCQSLKLSMCAHDLRSDAELCAQQFTPTRREMVHLTWAKIIALIELIPFFLVMYTHSLNNSNFFLFFF